MDNLTDNTKTLDAAPGRRTATRQANPGDAEACNHRAVARQARGDLAGALDDYDRALAFRPDYAEALHNRATARHLANDLPGAVADFDRALALRPDNALFYDHRGYAHYCRWEHAAAVADYTRALELYDPGPAADGVRCRLYLHRGDGRYHAGNPAAALDDYRAAFRLDCRLAASLLVDRLVRDAQANLAGVLADCAAQLRDNPEDAIGHARRGLIRLLQGRAAEARQEFERFFRAHPEDRAPFEVVIATARGAPSLDPNPA